MKHAKINLLILLILLTIAIIYRYDLLFKPLWIDEVLFYNLAQNLRSQEYVPVLIAKFLSLFVNIKQEFWLRFPFLFSSLLLIVITYYTINNKYLKFSFCAIIAIFPLYVFWSTMARPYIMSLVFMSLGWFYPIFYLPMILTTPLSVVGLNWFKFKKRYILYIVILFLAFLFIKVRPDSGNSGFLTWEFLKNAKRIHLLCYHSILLHAFQFFDAKWLGKRLC